MVLNGVPVLPGLRFLCGFYFGLLHALISTSCSQFFLQLLFLLPAYLPYLLPSFLPPFVFSSLSVFSAFSFSPFQFSVYFLLRAIFLLPFYASYRFAFLSVSFLPSFPFFQPVSCYEPVFFGSFSSLRSYYPLFFAACFSLSGLCAVPVAARSCAVAAEINDFTTFACTIFARKSFILQHRMVYWLSKC